MPKTKCNLSKSTIHLLGTFYANVRAINVLISAVDSIDAEFLAFFDINRHFNYTFICANRVESFSLRAIQH